MEKLSPNEMKLMTELNRKAGIILPRQFIGMTVTMPDGNVLFDKTEPGHSYVRNYYNMVWGMSAVKNLSDSSFGAGYMSLKDTAGNVHAMPNGVVVGGAQNYTISVISCDTLDTNNPLNYGGTGILAQSTFATYGIQVGLGTNPYSFEDYKVQTLVANGTGANQLLVAASGLHNPSYNAGTLTWTDTVSRYWNNNGSGNVVIGETGLVCGILGSAYTTYLILMSHDVLGATVTVPPAGQLKVTYTTTMVMPF